MFDIVIIGAGPAGMTAALYALRAGKTVALLECNSFGGQISYSPCVENFPSIVKISGEEFSAKLLDQVTDLGADIEFERATGIIRKGDKKVVVCESGNTFECFAVIIATGVKHRHLGVTNEDILTGKGVSYCAVCDGAFFKGKDVAVVGGGDTALQDALYLSKLCNKTYLIHRRNEFRAEKALVLKINSLGNIELLLDSNITALTGEKVLDSIEVTKNDGTKQQLKISGLFIAIGQIPENKPFCDVEALDDNGYFVTDEATVTKTDGVFVAGDCRRKLIRQLTTAVSDGSVAATKACQYIDKL